VQNLVLNALAYSGGDEPIDVAIDPSGDAVVLTISDRGFGIPEAEREQVLRPYVRGSNAELLARNGLGVGLAIVSGHVRDLRGSFALTPREGGGTTASVRFPHPGAAAPAGASDVDAEDSAEDTVLRLP
jgi:signal transduction histidine kinase